MLVTVACGEDPEPAAEGSTSTGGTTEVDTSSSSSSSSTTDDSSSSAGPAGPRICKRAGEIAATCCPAGQENCPSQAYPGNYGCQDGACVPPLCMNDVECEGETPGTTCHDVDGAPRCVALCDADPMVCDIAGQSCLGQTDAGSSFCRASCTDGTVFCSGGTICDDASGLCLCEDGQCPAGFVCG
jgi:hypothetical protein